MNQIPAKTKGIIAAALLAVNILISVFRTVRSFAALAYPGSFFTVYRSSLLSWGLTIFFAVALLLDRVDLAKIARILVLASSALSLIRVLPALGNSSNAAISLIASVSTLVMNVLLLLAFNNLGAKGRKYCFFALGVNVLGLVIRSVATHGNPLLSLFSVPQLLFYAALVMTAFYVGDKGQASAGTARKSAYEDASSRTAAPRNQPSQPSALKTFFSDGTWGLVLVVVIAIVFAVISFTDDSSSSTPWGKLGVSKSEYEQVYNYYKYGG